MNKLLWLPIAFVILVISVAIYQWARNKLFEQKLFSTGKTKRVAEWLDANLRYTIIVCYFLIFVGFVALIYFVFGEEHLLSGFVFGALIVSFIIFELQRLAKPNIYVVSLPARDDKTYEDIPQLNITVTAGEKALLFFRITNLGLNNYQNCTFWFTFPEGFLPLVDKDLYDGIDFRKEFQLQRQNRCAVFLPNRNYQNLAMGNHICFAIWVQTPQATDDTKKEILVLCTSETRWGEGAKKLPVGIVQKEEASERSNNRLTHLI